MEKMERCFNVTQFDSIWLNVTQCSLDMASLSEYNFLYVIWFPQKHIGKPYQIKEIINI